MDFDKATGQLGRFSPMLRKLPAEIKESVFDVTLSVGKPVLLYTAREVLYLRESGAAARLPGADCPSVSRRDMEEIFRTLSGYSLYSHTSELREGFLSTQEGLRIGISGRAVTENGALRTVRDITSLTLRIPREMRGCVNPLLRSGLRPEGGVLFAGEPSSGKTTLLRDLARHLGTAGKRVAVVDERFELAADGFDLGTCTEVLSGYPKGAGLAHAIRCLSPEYVLCDELGEGDLDAVRAAAFSGVVLIASVHADGPERFCRRPLCRALVQTGAFRSIVFLRGRKAPAQVEAVLGAGDLLARDSAGADPALAALRGGIGSDAPQSA